MRTLTNDVIAALEAHGLTVGDGQGGKIVQGKFVAFDPPFVVVHPLITERDGSLEDPFSDVRKWFELRGEAITREQAEWIAGEIEEGLRASTLVLVELNTSRVPRSDATASPSRWTSYTRAEIRAHTPTGV